MIVNTVICGTQQLMGIYHIPLDLSDVHTNVGNINQFMRKTPASDDVAVSTVTSMADDVNCGHINMYGTQPLYHIPPAVLSKS